MKRKRLRIGIWLAVIYLVITAAIAVFVEMTYRKDLGRVLSSIGKDSFKDTASLISAFKGDSEVHRELHRYGTLLRFTPPLGWFTARRLEHLDDRVIFASRNYALPESQRFADPEEARSFGFDPAKRTDDDIVEGLLSATGK